MARIGEGGAADAERARRLAAVFANPVRVKLLNALATDSPLAADVLSARVGEPLHKVRRHLNFLVSSDLVKVAGEESRRNARKRYFAIEGKPRIERDELVLLSERDRRRSAVGVLRLIFEDATRAASDIDLGRRADVVLVNSARRVDERGWRELSELHHEMLAQVERIVAESGERLAAGGEGPIGIVSDQILLEAPQHAPDAEA